MATRKSASKKSVSRPPRPAAGGKKKAPARKKAVLTGKKKAPQRKKTALTGKKKAPQRKKTAQRAKKPVAQRKQRTVKNRLATADIRKLRALLLSLRNRVAGQISFLADDANHKDDTPTDDRTDEFDREFALNLVSTEQNALYEIDEALRRIKNRIYGRCEYCDGGVEINRLQALPFVRTCVKCQSDIEQGKIHEALPSPSADEGEYRNSEDAEAP